MNIQDIRIAWHLQTYAKEKPHVSYVQRWYVTSIKHSVLQLKLNCVETTTPTTEPRSKPGINGPPARYMGPIKGNFLADKSAIRTARLPKGTYRARRWRAVVNPISLNKTVANIRNSSTSNTFCPPLSKRSFLIVASTSSWLGGLGSHRSLYRDTLSSSSITILS